MVIAIIVLSFVDLLRIDHRGETLKDNKIQNNYSNAPEYVSAIESFNDKSTFRILNLKKGWTSEQFLRTQTIMPTFLLQDLYGYSGIKPRAYQDYMDVLGSPANQTLWRMANVKYIILR